MPTSTLTRSFSSIYFSNLLRSPVLTQGGQRLGILKDLVALADERPRVVACIIKTKGGSLKTLNWDYFIIAEEEHKYQLICKQEKEISPPANAIRLNRDILDQQIVDVDDKKVVRVNDIRLAFLASGAFPVAVDVGLSGLLRRLGIVEFVTSILEWFHFSIPSRLIVWSNIELLAQRSRNLKLSVTQSKLHTFHPSDLSDIIEDLDAKTRAAIFNSLDYEKAADVLEEMEDEAKVSLVEDLPVEKVADVLEKMPSDEVADILGDLKEEKAEELLQEMDKTTSNEVRELMEYEEDTAGSLMSTDFFSFTGDTNVATVISEIRKQKPEADSIYSIYVTDKLKHLIGEVTLRDLILAEPSAQLSSIMKKPIRILDTDHVSSLTRLISKYTLLSIPVVSDDKILLGSIVIDDIIHEIFKNKRVTL